MDPVSRARELLALAGDPGASEHEAATSAKILVRLLRDHKIELGAAPTQSEAERKREAETARAASYRAGYVDGHRTGVDAMASQFRRLEADRLERERRETIELDGEEDAITEALEGLGLGPREPRASTCTWDRGHRYGPGVSPFRRSRGNPGGDDGTG